MMFWQRVNHLRDVDCLRAEESPLLEAVTKQRSKDRD
jgi:hypothetical protein